MERGQEVLEAVEVQEAEVLEVVEVAVEARLDINF